MRPPWLLSSFAFAVCAVVVAYAQPAPPPVPPPAPEAEKPAADAVPTVRFSLFDLSLDPHSTREVESFRACAAIYDTLYTYETGPEPVIKPSLADGFPKVSEDGLTWTIKLRKDARFHNSTIFENRTRSLTASDVVTSFKRMASRGTETGMYWLISDVIKGLDDYGMEVSGTETAGADQRAVEGLTAVDDSTVQFKLTRPYGGLLTFMAHPGSSIVPREAIEQWGAQLGIRAVGTGPYRVHAFSPGSIVVLKRFAGYWGEKPAFERVVLSREQASGMQLERFNDRRLAYIELNDVLLAQLQPGGKPGPVLVNTGATPEFSDHAGMSYLAFNMQDPIWGALDDDGRALRKAVGLALDREKLGADAGFAKGWVRPAHEAIAPGCEFGDLAAEHSLGVTDAKAAKEVLDASKYKGGIDPATKEALTLELVLMSSSYDRSLSQALRVSLKPLGITVTTQYVRGALDAYHPVIRESTGHAFYSGWNLDSPDAQNFLQLYHGENVGNEREYENHARYRSPDFDKAYKQFESLLPTPENTAKRRELVGQMLKQMAKDRPIVPLTVRKQCELRSPKVVWPSEPRATYNELRRLTPAKAEGE